jgi:hypothetical protein
MAPKITALAFLAAFKASSVKGVPWASIEHWSFDSARLTKNSGTDLHLPVSVLEN